MSAAGTPPMERLGRFVVRRRRWVVVAGAAITVLAGAFGAGVADDLSAGGFDAPNSESTRAAEFLEERFGVGELDVLLLVTADAGSVDAEDAVAAGEALTAELAAQEGVADAVSYWSLGRVPPLRSLDGSQALVLARLDGDQDRATEIVEEIGPRFDGRTAGPLDVRLSGFAEVFRASSEQIEEDLLRAELVVVPITAVLLVLIFRSVVAAALPMMVGGIAVLGTFAVLRVIAGFTEVSVFALNMTTAAGLGLGVDYSLFVVSRFREELAAGHGTEEAVVRTVSTAGRMVVFSAVTVAAALLALLVFPLAFLRSFGFAGMAVAGLAGASAFLLLPAVLAMLGPGIERWSVRRPRPAEGPSAWHRIASFVMRRPFPIAAGGVVFLLVLGAPFLRIELGQPDERVLPPGAPSRTVIEEFRENFSANEGFPIYVAAEGVGDLGARAAQLDDYAARLSALPGIVRVDAATGFYADGARIFADEQFGARFDGGDATYLSLVPQPDLAPFSPEAERLVEAIRSEPSPFETTLSGQSASFFDSKDVLFDRLPLAALIIGGVTFLVLLLAFGSVLVPLKAIVLNLLSLTATFGAMVWIFQDGNLSGLLDFTPRETIDIFNPILMFAIAFGISMDYEVFLLSRIKEEYDRTGDNTASVVAGVDRTGRLITAAAVLLAAVFLSFATGRVSIIKVFGLGLAIAILVDAFVIRATLVPAFMKLAGRANWWAPGWLHRLSARVAIHGPAAPPARPASTAPVATATVAVAPPQVRRPGRPLVAAGRRGNGAR